MSQELATIQAPIVVDTPKANELTPVQRRAIIALLEHATLGKAARVVEKSERTLYRWMRNPAFRRRLEEVIASREKALTIQALHGASTAFETLNAIAVDKYNDPHTRVQAARNLLEYALRK